MATESESGQFLSQVEAGIIELERAVQGLELAAVGIEKLVEEVEQLENRRNGASRSTHQELARALHASYNEVQRVLTINAEVEQSIDQAEHIVLQQELADPQHLAPLANGTVILKGKYRLLRLLYQRPRVHLYLAKRLPGTSTEKNAETSLVVIRELVLTGLTHLVRQQIEQAAFAEFAAPRYFGSPHLPGIGDRPQIERARHYLVVQPNPTRGRRPAFATTLAESLPAPGQAFDKLEMSTMLHWSIQLCLTVARLKGIRNILGELTPETIVVARVGRVGWSPLLLPCWPPSPAFWPGDCEQETEELYKRLFPPVATNSGPETEAMHPFVAPETLEGHYDERSDVYNLGALLYLLFTRRVPPSAGQRLRAEQPPPQGRPSTRRHFKNGLLRLLAAMPGTGQQFVLTPPHLLNEHVSPLLEHIILRALALNPEQRFASPLDLAKTLEGMKFKADTSTTSSEDIARGKVSQMKKLVEWLKKELND